MKIKKKWWKGMGGILIGKKEANDEWRRMKGRKMRATLRGQNAVNMTEGKEIETKKVKWWLKDLYQILEVIKRM